jgi:hypothetical protein
VPKKVTEYINGLINLYILATGKIMSLMEKVNTHGQTEEDIKVYGNKIK